MKSKNISDRVVQHIVMRSNEELANITIRDIANALGVNPLYISGKFLKDKKFPLSVYLDKMKVLRAASILREINCIPADALAKNLGFRTTGRFIRVFKKYFGVPPDKYWEYQQWISINRLQ